MKYEENIIKKIALKIYPKRLHYLKFQEHSKNFKNHNSENSYNLEIRKN